jgi:nucleotide-binding universal stress UspA family protein
MCRAGSTERIRYRKEKAMFKTIIWATDGSEIADLALPFAKELAERESGRLVVVHSNEKFTGRASGYPVFADEEDLESKIESQVEALCAEGLDATFTLVTGASAEAAHSIADVAGREDADLIVVGTRGHGPIAGVIIGSVTQRLLHVAPCPVLAVPAVVRNSERSTPREHALIAD